MRNESGLCARIRIRGSTVNVSLLTLKPLMDLLASAAHSLHSQPLPTTSRRPSPAPPPPSSTLISNNQSHSRPAIYDPDATIVLIGMRTSLASTPHPLLSVDERDQATCGSKWGAGRLGENEVDGHWGAIEVLQTMRWNSRC